MEFLDEEEGDEFPVEGCMSHSGLHQQGTCIKEKHIHIQVSNMQSEGCQEDGNN